MISLENQQKIFTNIAKQTNKISGLWKEHIMNHLKWPFSYCSIFPREGTPPPQARIDYPCFVSLFCFLGFESPHPLSPIRAPFGPHGSPPWVPHGLPMGPSSETTSVPNVHNPRSWDFTISLDWTYTTTMKLQCILRQSTPYPFLTTTIRQNCYPTWWLIFVTLSWVDYRVTA